VKAYLMPSSSAEFLFVFATKLWWHILPHKSIKSQGIFAFNSCAGVSPALRDLLPRQKPTPAPLGRLLLFNAFHSSLWHFMTNGSRCQRLPLACCSLVAMEPTRWTFEPLTIALFFRSCVKGCRCCRKCLPDPGCVASCCCCSEAANKAKPSASSSDPRTKRHPQCDSE